MAKRATADELPYNPIDAVLSQSVITGAGSTQVARRTARSTVELDTRQSPSIAHPKAISGSPGGHTASNETGTAAANVQRLCRQKRVLLSVDEERQIERFVDDLGAELGATLKLSHLLRACMSVLCHAETEILRCARDLRPLPRPANGDAVGLAQFEQAVARLLSRAFRDTPAIR